MDENIGKFLRRWIVVGLFIAGFIHSKHGSFENIGRGVVIGFISSVCIATVSKSIVLWKSKRNPYYINRLFNSEFEDVATLILAFILAFGVRLSEVLK